MRTIHSVGGGRSPKSLCDDGTQYQTKYTDKQFGNGYKTSEGGSDIVDDDSDAGSENTTESDTQSDDGESDTGSDAGLKTKENDYNNWLGY